MPIASDALPVIQRVRFNAGAIAGTTTADVVVTWPTPFADTNYAVSAVLHDTIATANNNALRQIFNKTASTVTVRLSTGTTAYTSGQLVIDMIGVHD